MVNDIQLNVLSDSVVEVLDELNYHELLKDVAGLLDLILSNTNFDIASISNEAAYIKEKYNVGKVS